MKALLLPTAFLLATLSFLAGCRKDVTENATDSPLPGKAAVSKRPPHELPLKASMDVYSTYTPDYANGGCYCAPYLPGYMTGTGEGNSTLLGKFYSYSNWYAYYDAAWRQQTYSVPLPDDYYQKLSPYFTVGEVQAIKDAQVEVIFFDRQGNAIWSKVDDMAMDMSPTDSLHFSLSGEGVIVGGTGKFAGARGTYTFTGYADVFRDSAPGVPYLYSFFDMKGRIEY